MGHFIYPSLVNQIQVHWMPVIRDFRQSCSSSKHDSFKLWCPEIWDLQSRTIPCLYHQGFIKSLSGLGYIPLFPIVEFTWT